MKLMLAQNIRTQRKAHSLTQENLAEAMGVTVGAVSKWENGTTSPDLVTLMGLADLFGTSVDALLGYQLGGHTVQSTVEELHTLQQKKEYQAGTAKAENALQRYHNNFAIVRAAANIYYMAGFEQNNAAWLRRALELQEREMLLFEQNTDPCISEDFIQCESARIYDQLGQREKALEILKNHNAGGINGGITNGNEIVVRAALKPTPSIGREQITYNLATNRVEPLEIHGRHDVCVALRLSLIHI